MSLRALRRSLLVALLSIAGCRLFDRGDRREAPAPWREVRAWMLLSASVEDAEAVIARARAYDVNQLQLSHQIVSELRDLRRPDRRERVLALARAARQAGIGEVLVWDRAPYPADHYPPALRAPAGGGPALDDPALHAWVKEDYRAMLDLLPDVDGLVLTVTRPARLAAIVDTIADVVVGERRLRLYVRVPAPTRAERELAVAGLRQIARPEVRLMMKEAPDHFFLTHPVEPLVGEVARPTLVEFDAAGETSGQGQIAGTFADEIARRWGELQRRPHVVGYVARVDHYGASRVIGRPSEVLLWVLKRRSEDPQLGVEALVEEFVRARYGAGAVAHLPAAFATARDVVTSVLYTLGTSTTRNSGLDYEHAGAWGRNLSGKWLDPPEVEIGHGVDRRFHFWKDVVDHLAPARFKGPDGPLAREAPWVLARGWVAPEERMTEAFLGHVANEKTFGVARAEEALRHVEAARDDLPPGEFDDLHDYFQRTWLTARLHRAVATAYFGYRVWARGDAHRTPTLARTVRAALDEIPVVVSDIRKHPGQLRAGVWKWSTDAVRAMEYHDRITARGWPEYGAEPFPSEAR